MVLIVPCSSPAYAPYSVHLRSRDRAVHRPTTFIWHVTDRRRPRLVLDMSRDVWVRGESLLGRGITREGREGTKVRYSVFSGSQPATRLMANLGGAIRGRGESVGGFNVEHYR